MLAGGDGGALGPLTRAAPGICVNHDFALVDRASA